MKFRFWNPAADDTVGQSENLKPAESKDCNPTTPNLDDPALPDTNDADLSDPGKEHSHSGDLEEQGGFLKKFWFRHVALDDPPNAVNPNANRDHLSNEQTFLAWLSLADGVSILGILIAQISRIQHVLRPYEESSIRYLVLGKPQACLCQATACLILAVGAQRFLRQQRAIHQGHAIVGGLEVPLIGVLLGLCLTAFFLLLVLIDIAGIR